jgi:hypothetical protein
VEGRNGGPLFVFLYCALRDTQHPFMQTVSFDSHGKLARMCYLPCFTDGELRASVGL